MMEFLTLKNQQTAKFQDIPIWNYEMFMEKNLQCMEHAEHNHCVLFFAVPFQNLLQLICCIANDEKNEIYVSACRIDAEKQYPSFTAKNYNFEKFEREIHEKYGVQYIDHPWLKPVRYAEDRYNRDNCMENYPFYSIESDELHEVGVGPVHAGVIEPGHFRFICNGEQILHLEIQLGYQHRGIENLFLQKKNLLQRITLAENIAGDSVIEHASAFAYLWESLAGFEATPSMLFERTLAQEIERIAIHTGDLSAICTDIAYQLGSSVFGRLRTPVINFFQEWCGNRLAKSLIRPFQHPYKFSEHLKSRLLDILEKYEPDFTEMNKQLFSLPSALSRLERTGVVSKEQLLSIGAVGMAARMNDVKRDIRFSHPYGLYPLLNHAPIIKHHGDVYSRAQIRKEEVFQSIKYIKQLLQELPQEEAPKYEQQLKPNSFAISLTEGWRGEVCHAAITDENGELMIYKIKDPSFHNWMALALAVRNNEISDFPICNKSFNLSYCGHDL